MAARSAELADPTGHATVSAANARVLRARMKDAP
jgi:hypothetical protein